MNTTDERREEFFQLCDRIAQSMLLTAAVVGIIWGAWFCVNLIVS